MVEDSRSTLRPAKFYILDFTFLFIQKALNCSDSVKGLDVKFTILETPEIQLRHFCAFRIGLHPLGWRASPADEGAKNFPYALQELFVDFRPSQRLQKTSRLGAGERRVFSHDVISIAFQQKPGFNAFVVGSRKPFNYMYAPPTRNILAEFPKPMLGVCFYILQRRRNIKRELLMSPQSEQEFTAITATQQSHNRNRGLHRFPEIGRASCRERVGPTELG